MRQRAIGTAVLTLAAGLWLAPASCPDRVSDPARSRLTRQAGGTRTGLRRQPSPSVVLHRVSRSQNWPSMGTATSPTAGSIDRAMPKPRPTQTCIRCGNYAVMAIDFVPVPLTRHGRRSTAAHCIGVVNRESMTHRRGETVEGMVQPERCHRLAITASAVVAGPAQPIGQPANARTAHHGASRRWPTRGTDREARSPLDTRPTPSSRALEQTRCACDRFRAASATRRNQCMTRG